MRGDDGGDDHDPTITRRSEEETMPDFLKMGREQRARERAARGEPPPDPAQERGAATETAYRVALRRAFTLAGRGAELSPDECDQVLDQLAALTDTIGVARAETIRGEEKAKWLTATRRCPYCGGPAHE
jgi:hypothetical protein